MPKYEPFQHVEWQAASGHTFEGKVDEKGRLVYSLGHHSSNCGCLEPYDVSEYCGEDE